MSFSKLSSVENARANLEMHEQKLAHLRDLLMAGQYELNYRKAVLRSCVSEEFYIKYDEHPHVVRQRYIDLVESLAYKEPLEPKLFGYAFELYNIIPVRGLFEEVIFQNRVLFVSEENIAKCKLDQKTVDAFLSLKKLPEMKGFGFGIDRKIRAWGSIAPTNPGVFDYEGYKWHLE